MALLVCFLSDRKQIVLLEAFFSYQNLVSTFSEPYMVLRFTFASSSAAAAAAAVEVLKVEGSKITTIGVRGYFEEFSLDFYFREVKFLFLR